MAQGWRRGRPNDEIVILPITDGGDGFGAILGALLGCETRETASLDAAHRPCTATWFWHAKTRTAVIESANVIGLAMLPAGKFHPFQLDTGGLGSVLKAVAAVRPQRCILGIGGSATNDGGFGLARSLGWRFLSRDGTDIDTWTSLNDLAQVIAPRPRRMLRRLVVAVDVANPLLGPSGATRVYGPQKGVRPKDLALAEACLGRLARVIQLQFSREWHNIPGAGAAGGLGFGLMAFLGARPMSGFDLFARYSRLATCLADVDCVLTGEGKIDRSTTMGKGIGKLATLCLQRKVPCIAFGGIVELLSSKQRLFTHVSALTEVTTLAGAKTQARRYLARLAEQAARSFVR